MGIFDGYLLCSDLDGTFRCSPESAEAHSKAVKYFVENGGRFTFATGRPASHMREQPFFDLINAPACLFNGAYIYDFAQEKVLCERKLDFSVGAFMDAIAGAGFCMTRMHIPMNGMEAMLGLMGEEIGRIPPDVLACIPLKLVCVFATGEEAEAFQAFLKTLPLLNNCYISRSWRIGVEVTSAAATKGHGLDFIKKYLGNIHTAVGVGDYENDIPLLRHADIGVAMGNAVDSVKQAADWVVKPCSEFGLAQLIELLENRQKGTL